MKIIVCVKQVINAYVKVRPNSEHTDIKPDNLRYCINPFDEIAIEEAVSIKEGNSGVEVIVVSIGNNDIQESIRKALAMGCDRAIHITTTKSLSTLDVAKTLAKIVEQENPQLVILGKQSIDGDHNHTGQMLAALLEWPQGTFISKLTIEDSSITITSEVDDGLKQFKLQLPSVLTTDLRLNKPRYPSLPNIMKAKQKTIDEVDFDSLDIELNTDYEITAYHEPPARASGVIVNSVDELLDTIKLTKRADI